MLEAKVDQLVLEFARKGYDDLQLAPEVRLGPRRSGSGVVDVKSEDIETSST